MKAILVPTDGSEAALKALDIACDLAEKHGAAVKLLHVLLRDKEPDELLRLAELDGFSSQTREALAQAAAGPDRQPRTPDELMANPNFVRHQIPESVLQTLGDEILKTALSRAQERGVAADRLPTADGKPAQVILERVQSEGADTIVMGTRGLRQIDAMTLGSVSNEVTRKTSCTCITVH